MCLSFLPVSAYLSFFLPLSVADISARASRIVRLVHLLAHPSQGFVGLSVYLSAHLFISQISFTVSVEARLSLNSSHLCPAVLQPASLPETSAWFPHFPVLIVVCESVCRCYRPLICVTTWRNLYLVSPFLLLGLSVYPRSLAPTF